MQKEQEFTACKNDTIRRQLHLLHEQKVTYSPTRVLKTPTMAEFRENTTQTRTTKHASYSDLEARKNHRKRGRTYLEQENRKEKIAGDDTPLSRKARHRKS